VAGSESSVAGALPRRPLVFGHLGNTIEALRRVRSTGADGVEFDVRRAADGTLVLHHDPVVDGVGLITRLAGDELPGWLPRLDAALGACRGLVVNVEVKNLRRDPDHDPAERAATAVAALLGRLEARGQVLVSSFSLPTIDAVRDADPGIDTALLTLPSWDQARAAREAADHGHRAVNPHLKGLTPDGVDVAHSLGLRVNAWAVDTAVDVRSVLAHAVDGLISDAPDVAVAAVCGGGTWGGLRA
jgi:glycerophosphoryl diester phosphodiesterase